MAALPSGYPTLNWARLYTETAYYFFETEIAAGTDGITDASVINGVIYRNGSGTGDGIAVSPSFLSVIPSPLDVSWRAQITYTYQKESVASPGNFYTFILGIWLSERFLITRDLESHIRDQWHGVDLPGEALGEGYTDSAVDGDYTAYTADQSDPYEDGGAPPPPVTLSGTQPNMPPSYLPNVSNAKGHVKSTGTRFSRAR